MTYKEGRQIVWAGEGEPSELTRRLMEEHEEKDPHGYGRTPTAEQREILDKIDFKVLRQIFSDMYERYGLDPANLNFFDADEISHASSQAVGEYKPFQNDLRLDFDYLKDLKNIPPDLDQDLYVLTTLIHEEIHAVSRILLEFSEARQEVPRETAGYSTDRAGAREPFPGRNWAFDDFDEGLIELIDLEIAREYAVRTGKFSKHQLQNMENHLYDQSYGPNMEMVNTFVSKLSKLSGLAKEEIWDGIKAGQFLGDNLYKSTLREYLDAELGEEYMKKLEAGEVYKKPRPDRSRIEKAGRNLKAWILKLHRKNKKGKQ